MEDLSVTEFINLLNISLDSSFHYVSIIGEISEFKIRKNQWVYFNLKDENSTLNFFGSINNIKTELIDGMLVRVVAKPRMHNNFGFSLNFYSISPFGEGSIKKSLDLLKNKLEMEGLFDISKKRKLAYPPNKICLITSTQSAAYGDFMKILKNRWGAINVDVIDVLVQGENARNQIINALNFCQNLKGIEVIVIIRGGGSLEDLSVFNDEQLTRVIDKSKVPTLVAIGHEIDVCLAELAADMRASTPSNAAEQLVPDKQDILEKLNKNRILLEKRVKDNLEEYLERIFQNQKKLDNEIKTKFNFLEHSIENKSIIVEAYKLDNILEKGFSIVRKNGKLVRDEKDLRNKDILNVKLYKGNLKVEVKK
ncbi:MAG: exodeoxyribonuclease VII large subunit [Patescibacteria group bacterium]|nr:exodeoxyribonuclease VII large subunit [Patescibacteria group bacterium]